MFAVIKTGGKQYRVAQDDVIEIEKVAGEAGDKVEFSEVLMIGGDSPKVGTPAISGASVSGEIVAQKRARKITVFKKKRAQKLSPQTRPSPAFDSGAHHRDFGRLTPRAPL